MYGNLKKYIETLIIPTGLIALYSIYYGIIIGKGNFFMIHSGDAQVYYQMATTPFKFIREPFSYRILIPVLSHYSPLPNIWDFRIINLVSLYALLIAIYEYLKTFEFSHKMSVFGTALFVPMHTVLYTISNIALVDFPAYLLLTLALISIKEKNAHLFGVSIFVGVLIKETVLFAVPVFIGISIFTNYETDSNTLKTYGLYIFLSVLELLLIRYSLSGTYTQTGGTMYDLLIYHYQTFPANIVVGLILLFNLQLISIFWFEDFDPFLKTLYITLLPISFGTLALAADFSRMMTINYLIFIPSSIYMINNVRSRVNAFLLNRPVPYSQSWFYYAVFSIFIGTSLLCDLLLQLLRFYGFGQSL